MQSRYKRLVSIVGFALGITGAFFVGFKLYDYIDEVNFRTLGFLKVLYLSLLPFIYGISGILLAVSWRNILTFTGKSTDTYFAIKTYGISQIAKYIPGNIFHLASRQVIGAGYGIPHSALAKSAFFEILLLVVSGSLFLPLVLPFLFKSLSAYFVVFLFTIAVLSAYFLIGKFINNFLAKSLGLHVLFLCISGLVFFAVLVILLDDINTFSGGISYIIGVYVIAWLVGLVTPGAPAGVGIREIVLLFLLNSTVPESVLVLSIVCNRIVTISGDLIFYLLSSALPSKKN